MLCTMAIAFAVAYITTHYRWRARESDVTGLQLLIETDTEYDILYDLREERYPWGFITKTEAKRLVMQTYLSGSDVDLFQELVESTDKQERSR